MKLRIWDKSLKQMFYSQKKIIKYGIYFDANESLVDTDPILMWSTGIEDDFGKTIYEGDIIHIYSGGKDKYKIDTYAEAIFSEGCFGLDLYGFICFKDLCCYNIEVVGNIYEGKMVTPLQHEKKKHNFRYIFRRIKRMVKR